MIVLNNRYRKSVWILKRETHTFGVYGIYKDAKEKLQSLKSCGIEDVTMSEFPVEFMLEA